MQIEGREQSDDEKRVIGYEVEGQDIILKDSKSQT